MPRYWTHPESSIPQRVLLEINWTGGHRHGGPYTQEQYDFDRWWRKRVSEIIRRAS